jgi:hypothetical protein
VKGLISSAGRGSLGPELQLRRQLNKDAAVMMAIFELAGAVVGLAVATLDVLFTWIGRKLPRREKSGRRSSGHRESL